MTRSLVVIAAFLTLSLPAALAAPPEGKGKPESAGKSAAAPGQSADKNAAKKCKAERALGAEAFKTKYKSNGLGKCIQAQKQKTKKDKAKDEAEENEAEDNKAEENAAKQCKAERDQIGLVEFKKKYAPPGHPTGANAYGKCVSKLSKAATG